MRRIGIVLLVIGLAGFLLATSQRARYDSVEGGLKATFSSSERSKKETWETARWMLLGVAVIGIVFTVLPGKRA
jgi:hypothetical protein